MSTITYVDESPSTTTVAQEFVLPLYPGTAYFPPPVKGGMLLNTGDGFVYVSNGRTWSAGSVAPAQATYVVATASAGLLFERILTAGTDITVTDGGPGSTITIGTTAYAPDTATYLTVTPTVGALPNERVLTAGTNIVLTDGGAGSTLTVSSTAAALNDAPYILLSANGSLSNSVVLTAGTNISFVDAGAGSTLTVSTLPPASLSAEYLTTSVDATLTDERVITAGTGISLSSGATSTLALSPPNANDTAAYVVMAASGGLSAERVLTAGTHITLTDGGANGNATITFNQPMTTTGDLLYYNAGLQRLAIGSSGNVLRPIAGVPAWSDYVLPAIETFYFDDFSFTNGDHAWIASTQSGYSVNSTLSTVPAGQHPYGTYQISANGTGAHGYKKVVNTVVGNGICTFEAGVWILGGAPTAGDDYNVNIGLADTLAATTVDAANTIKFTIDRTTSATNWVARCISASAPTSLDTLIPITFSGFVRLKFVINAAATSVEFFVNDVSGGTIAATIPTSRATPMFFIIHFRRLSTSGAVTRGYVIDYILWQVMQTGNRY